MKTTILAFVLFGLSGPGIAETITVTGQNRGSSVTNGTCQTSNGQMQCSSHTVVTGANGATGTRDRATVVSKGQITSTLTFGGGGNCG